MFGRLHACRVLLAQPRMYDQRLTACVLGVYLQPVAPALSRACFPFLAPGIGTAPLQMIQFKATWFRVQGPGFRAGIGTAPQMIQFKATWDTIQIKSHFLRQRCRSSGYTWASVFPPYRGQDQLRSNHGEGFETIHTWAGVFPPYLSPRVSSCLISGWIWVSG